MKTSKKLLVAGLAALVGAVALPSVGAFALDESWGPQNRPTYTWQSPADHRTFNSITDNPSIGDERNFVRVREVGTNAKYVDELNVEAGKYYEVYVYYHNNASANLNESGKGIANNVRLSMSIPENLKQGETAVIKGTISASNTEPTSVWDTAFLKAANSNIHLAYVDKSATLHNGGSSNGEVLVGTAMLSDEGANLAYWANSWGIVPGCNEYAGYVTFELLATTESTPETPPTPGTTTTGTPSSIPDTGPGEIILASVVAIAVIGGVIYYIRSRKAIKRIRK